MYGHGAWRELDAAPTHHPVYSSAVTAVRFDEQHEVVWSGNDAGCVTIQHAPTLELYCRWQAHQSSVVDMLASHGCCLSVSHEQAILSVVGGAPRLTFSDKESIGLSSCCLEPGQGGARALLGTHAGTIVSLDLSTGRSHTAGTVVAENSGDFVTCVRAPAGRGHVVVGLSSGQIGLADPRAQMKISGSMLSVHPGGLAAVDARADTVATCGYALRMGQIVPDNFVKVFDVRYALRPMINLPFPAGPTSLSFHPSFTTTLLIAGAGGTFSFADTAVGAVVQTYQVETGGDAINCCAMSDSAQCVAFGGSGGYVHLWTDQDSPTVNAQSEELQLPTLAGAPAVSLTESDSFSAAATYTNATGTRLLSDVDPSVPIQVGLPPRVIDPQLLVGMKTDDFIGHVANPHYSRGKAKGEPTAAVAALRSARVQMRAGERPHEAEAVRAEKARRRLEQGGVVLPMRYHPVEIKVQSSVRFEEFDFSFYNRTSFAGLENGLPNCYCNALLQMLYFTPPIRDLILAHKPEPDLEFCLTCELHFLFRMLATAVGTPCQAANLLSALRQVPEAAALGLLDGVNVPAGVALPEPEGPRAWALSRRVGALSRFLLDHMHKDTAVPAAPRTGIPQPAPCNAAIIRSLEDVAALRYAQRTAALGGKAPGGIKAEKIREAQVFQVDLQYPKAPATASFGVFGFPYGSAANKPAGSGATSTAPSPKSVGGDAGAQSAGTTPLASTPGSAASGGTRGRNVFAPSGPDGPSTFSDVLRKSLEAENETRAWFDEMHSYQHVRQSRVPVGLPKVFIINCSPRDASDVAWWLAGEDRPADAKAMGGRGARGTKGDEGDKADKADKGDRGDGPKDDKRKGGGGVGTELEPKLPWAIAVESSKEEWWMAVAQGACAREAAAALPSGGVATCRGVYELSGVLSHVRDADADEDSAKSKEGQLVACVRVPKEMLSSLGSARALPHGGAESRGLGKGGAALGRLDLPDDLDDVFPVMTFEGGAAEARASGGGAGGGGGAAAAGAAAAAAAGAVPEGPASAAWLVANDFSLSVCPSSEVQNLYGGQKMPALLF
ncbi:hypothetical protein FOA52_014971 [Chlamydomonas sp. UWO 241]|nr:hypothetical protein FOA52_014971 [Chlamydomonas sp. UWO 241]